MGTCGCLFLLKGTKSPPKKNKKKHVAFLLAFFFGGNGSFFFAALKNLFNPAMFGECIALRGHSRERGGVFGVATWSVNGINEIVIAVRMSESYLRVPLP